MLPPGGSMEIVFSFDTTGSMGECLVEATNNIQTIVKRLQTDIPGIRMAVFAHADYCNHNDYVTKYIDFTTDITKITDFVKEAARPTGGGDLDECYELVLRQVREELSWTPGSKRSLVLIGDANPHEPNYRNNTLNINWRDEADHLGKMGVKIYATECRPNSFNKSSKFYKTLAGKTGGHHLQLQDFSNIFDFLMAVAYREEGDELFLNYESEVRERRGAMLDNDLDTLFTKLRRDDTFTLPDSTDTSCEVRKARKRKGDTSTGKVKTAKKVKLAITTPYKKSTAETRRNIKKFGILQNKADTSLLRREMVPENNFILNDKNWSQWQKVICKDNSLSSNNNWSYNGEHYKKKIVFPTHPEKPAMFEFAVQTKPRARRYVVYNKMAHRITERWWNRLFCESDIKSQIRSITNRGYSLFVRRLLLESDKKQRETIQALRRYDYSWRKVRNQRIHHRHVAIGSQIISDGSL
ncbi:hypothetical protein LOTGIDRAFT_168082 [Lottia gigantea]|uniref:VWFA domain-containing protein n=1 Tax=Lottia gigantea TaxID=225164 RepID=V3ZVT8_LOTGI|nr:hypothetical protein LOTGIDRAFT_168082 [Lottia gigantea]ESO85061.1 hypothetical protein LOTGIDRAFT_168082 [Lottia gigantea]